MNLRLVSEGTDIPRLQVCCHLRRVKTELYFREVLGRILRVSNSLNQEAWLFIISEDKLTTFANRIDQELPDLCVLVRSNAVSKEFSLEMENNRTTTSTTNTTPAKLFTFTEQFSAFDRLNISNNQDCNSASLTYLKGFGGFREKLIEVFTTE